MGKFLAAFLCFCAGLTPLHGQRLLIRQPVEGFRGDGEIHAFSSSRIFLRLNKDGQWPRQILWEILKDEHILCTLTFNKVGWEYTPSVDACEFDWIHMDPNQFEHRLSVVQSIPSSSSVVMQDLSESLLLTRNINLPDRSVDSAGGVTARDPIINSQPSLKNSLIAGIHDSLNPIMDEQDYQLKHNDTAGNLKEDLVQNLLAEFHDTLNAPIRFPKSDIQFDSLFDSGARQVSNEMPNYLSLEDTSTSLQVNSQELANGIIPSQLVIQNPSDSFNLGGVSQSVSGTSSSILGDTNAVPEYIFTVPDFQPRRLRWKKKKLPSEMEMQVDSINASFAGNSVDGDTMNDMKLSEDSLVTDAEAITILKASEIDTADYAQMAPFISVASFETLSYTKQVLNQYTCPGGCIIVKSNKGFYYRIGFYPDPKNIAVDLREIRKIYSDAWLVK